MNVVRIRKHLDAPIPQLPELTSMIGKNVEIIVLEDGARQGDGLAPVRFEDLIGGWPEDQLGDGFEDAVEHWRREPWGTEDALNSAH